MIKTNDNLVKVSLGGYFDIWDIDGNLKDIIKKLEDSAEKAKKDHNLVTDITLSYEGCWDDHCTLDAWGFREETERETEKRVAKEKAKRAEVRKRNKIKCENEQKKAKEIALKYIKEHGVPEE